MNTSNIKSSNMSSSGAISYKQALLKSVPITKLDLTAKFEFILPVDSKSEKINSPIISKPIINSIERSINSPNENNRFVNRKPNYRRPNLAHNNNGVTNTDIIPPVKLPSNQSGNLVNLLSPILFTNVSNLLGKKQLSSIDKSSLDIVLYKRLMKEIKDIHDDFFNLRTVLIADPDDKMNVFYYMIVPNDGALYGLPLIGRVIIGKNYPIQPPVFHMLTLTNRYNVDIFNYAAENNDKFNSSMCFDLLKSAASETTWKPDYTLSAVFSSILQSVTSFKVPQMYGKDHDEFITMEKLSRCYHQVQFAIRKYNKYIPHIPCLPGNLGLDIDARPLRFPDTIYLRSPNYKTIFEISKMSEAIYLQSGKSYVAAFDITDLTENYVFSMILTSNPNDLTGRKKSTILFRNGVTASCATKLKNKSIAWGYHGKPLKIIKGRLFIKATITDREFTLAYDDITTNKKWVIHGDYPVALLNKKYVGDISAIPFHLVLYFKRKSGSNDVKIFNLYPEYGVVQRM